MVYDLLPVLQNRARLPSYKLHLQKTGFLIILVYADHGKGDSQLVEISRSDTMLPTSPPPDAKEFSYCAL